MDKKRVALGIVGSRLDAGSGQKRWDRWRPTVALCQQEDLVIDRLELWYQRRFAKLAKSIARDIAAVSPETEVCRREVSLRDPWDFAEVYAELFELVREYPFDPASEDYLAHITPGSHAWQICLFLLTESRHLPARLVQTYPERGDDAVMGSYSIIDLDLSRYDQLAERFAQEHLEGADFLKAGIQTKDASFNRLMERIEQVALASDGPILLTGATGVGKTQLARRIYELRRQRHRIDGAFVEVNCATLRGDQAMSALFGHVAGAFTGAAKDRAGFLRAADGGLLFLDEVGELGLDEQTMLLRALEERAFVPLGSDQPVTSAFQLIAGTNRDLRSDVRAGRFREDLLARIDLWAFRLPSLAERREDLEPNLEWELERIARDSGRRVSFNHEARESFLSFAAAPDTPWRANFRDFGAAMTRMATLSPAGRITREVVDEELGRLRDGWRSSSSTDEADSALEALLGDRATELDRFDRVQLAEVLRVCRVSPSLSAAGRTLFQVSRTKKRSSNDADRLTKYLARFGLRWQDL